MRTDGIKPRYDKGEDMQDSQRSTTDRYARLRDILPVDALSASFAIVGGSGVLGNEIVKNLALLGVGKVLICDFDDIELHNLTRSILFRQDDRGKLKSDVACARLEEINPDVHTISFPDSIGQLGLGFFRRADMIFATFDGMYPRYVINEACMQLGKVWVDGGMSAMDHTRGGVSVYDGSDPDTFCITCGDKPASVAQRISRMTGFLGCNAYEKALGELGGVPTTPMMASVIGGIQTSAAVSMVFKELDTEEGILWPFGLWEVDIGSLECTRIRKLKRASCYFHETVERIADEAIVARDDWTSEATTPRDILDCASADLSNKSLMIELPGNLYTEGFCSACGQSWDLFMLTSTYRVREERILCPKCGEGSFQNKLDKGQIAEIGYDSPYLDMPLAQLGWRPLDVVKVVKFDALGDEEMTRYYEITGDAAVFGLAGEITSLAERANFIASE